MSPYQLDSREVVEFLDAFQNASNDLPDSVTGYWRNAVAMCISENPNWNEGINFCECIVSVLNRLRSSEGNPRQLDGAHGQVLILQGAIHLGQADWTRASHDFRRAAKRLRAWRHTVCESLAHYGRALTHKHETDWAAALEAAQSALNLIRELPILERSIHTNRLQRHIEDAVNSISEAAAYDTAITPPKTFAIPIVSDIAAGRGVIAQDSIEDYLVLDENHCRGADFAVRVVGDSMTGDGILENDIALIRQQPDVQSGRVAALVITTSTDTIGVLKRYYPNLDRMDTRHWLLRSSNFAGDHLVIVPSGANVSAIRAFYEEEIRASRIGNRITYYEDAELAIAGQYVGLVRLS